MKLSDILNESTQLVSHLSMSTWGGDAVCFTVRVDKPTEWTGPEDQTITLDYLEMNIDPFAEEDDDDMPMDSQLVAYLSIDIGDGDPEDLIMPAEEWANSDEAKAQIAAAIESAGIPHHIAIDINPESVDDGNNRFMLSAYFEAWELAWYIRGTLLKTSGTKIHNKLGELALEFFDITKLDDSQKDRIMSNLLADIKRRGKVSARVKMAITQMIKRGVKWPELEVILRSAKTL